MTTGQLKRKQSAKAPTIAQSIRDKEKRMHDEYVHSLHACPMDMPRAIYFSSKGDDIEDVR